MGGCAGLALKEVAMKWTFLDGCRLSGSEASITIPSGALCTLAALLVLNRSRPVPRARIEDILWEGARPDNARDRINTMLWRLRKLIKKVGGDKKVIQNHRDYILYDDQDTESDVLEIGRLSRIVMREGISSRADEEICAACIQSCHTEFLPHATDHWSMITRESLRSGVIMITEALISNMRERGRWGRVTELAEKMLALDATLEIGHRQLIERHSARNDMQGALRHYDVMEKVLKDDLDIAPEPEIASAIDALKIARHRPERQAPFLVRRPSLESAQQALEYIIQARDSLCR